MTSDTRRGFFRLLAAITSAPATLALAKQIPSAPTPVISALIKVAIPQELPQFAKRQLAELAMIRLGLIAPGDIPSQEDYWFCEAIRKEHGILDSYHLALAIAPAFGITGKPITMYQVLPPVGYPFTL